MIAPTSLFTMLQSSEDYYQSFYAASWIRIVRFMFSIISMILPSLYVAITTFHPQIIPPNLLITIASARENNPFSALTEWFTFHVGMLRPHQAWVSFGKGIIGKWPHKFMLLLLLCWCVYYASL